MSRNSMLYIYSICICIAQQRKCILVGVILTVLAQSLACPAIL